MEVETRDRFNWDINMYVNRHLYTLLVLTSIAENKRESSRETFDLNCRREKYGKVFLSLKLTATVIQQTTAKLIPSSAINRNPASGGNHKYRVVGAKTTLVDVQSDKRGC